MVLNVFGDGSQSIRGKAAAMLAKLLLAAGVLSDQVRNQRRPQALSVEAAARISSLRFIAEREEQLRNEGVLGTEGRSKLEALGRRRMADYRAEKVGLDFNMDLFCSSSRSSGERNFSRHDVQAARPEVPRGTRLTKPGGFEEHLAAKKKSHAVLGEV